MSSLDSALRPDVPDPPYPHGPMQAAATRHAKAGSAVVVGGGIGGLTVALLLARKGVAVTLLERAREFGEVGAGINVSPNGARVLFALGLEPGLREAAFLPEALEMRTWRRAFPVLRTKLGRDVEARYGTPHFNLHRADLHGLLVDAVRAEPGIAVRPATGCTGIEQGPDGVQALTDAGVPVAADCLIGADGIKSVVRHALFGDDAPRFTGCVAWRGLIPAEAVDDAFGQPVVRNWVGPQAHVLNYYVRRGELLNIVALVEQEAWVEESWTTPGDKADLLERFEGWHPAVRRRFEAIDPATCFVWGLFDRDPMPTWSRERVTLLGDACHPMLPFMGQGACQAIEDAAVLADCLALDEPVAAFQRYESLRTARTARIQLGSRRNKALFHMKGPRALLRNVTGPLLGRAMTRSQEGLMGYDALSAVQAGA